MRLTVYDSCNGDNNSFVTTYYLWTCVLCSAVEESI